MIRVGIVDDHILTLKGTEYFLNGASDIDVIGSFTKGQAVLDYLQESPEGLDVLIVDLNMPEMNGVQLCKSIRQKFSKVRLIVLSMIDDLKVVERMLRYGVDGYLIKNAMQDELILAIQAVHRGEKYLNKKTSQLLKDQGLLPLKPKKTAMRPSLSHREMEILQLISQEYTTPEIAEKLFISKGTVITHRRHILSKLGVTNIAGMVRVAMDWGLIK